ASVSAHCRSTLNELDKLIDDPFTVLPVDAKYLPVCRYLDPSLRIAKQGPFSGLATQLSLISRYLQWEYGYADMPENLRHSFAYTEIAGEQSQIKSKQLAIGLVLFGPGCVYPPHGHPGITESYLVLSGTVSQNDFGVFGPGSLIFNPPSREHTITVDAMSPALLAYAWTAETGVLATNEMTLNLSDG
ncbi:MAG: dimethylsulfonioproprionate lyase family protein, partial [Pseudomonadota bacterium]